MNQLQSSRLSTINHQVTQRPHLCLLVSFVVWKLLLFIIVFVTPSPAYDTSTTILLRSRDPSQKTTENTLFSALLASAAEKLTRWDALYYVKVAERGYANEQEWAFSWGYTQLVNQVARGVFLHTGKINLLSDVPLKSFVHRISLTKFKLWTNPRNRGCTRHLESEQWRSYVDSV